MQKIIILIILFILGIASGLPLALSGSTLRIRLNELGISLSSIGFLSSISIIYSLKFLWAPLVDKLNLPFFNHYKQRKAWLLVIQVTLIILLFLLSIIDFEAQLLIVIILTTLIVFCSATQDIIIDAIRIEILDKQQQGNAVVIYTLGYRIGMLITSAGALYISEMINWYAVYLLALVILLISLLLVFGLDYKFNLIPNHYKYSSCQTNWFKKLIIEPLISLTDRKSWLKIFLFIILFKLGDAMSGMMTEIFLMDIGFNKIEIANIVKIFGTTATISGSFIGGLCIYRIGMKKSLWLATIIQAISNIMFIIQANIGLNYSLLSATIGIENFTSGISATILVCYLTSLCNIEYAATHYSILSSLANVARTSLASLSGIIAEHVSWPQFFSITVIASIPAIIMLYFINQEIDE